MVTTVFGATPDIGQGMSMIAPTIYLGEAELRDLEVTFGDLHVFRIWKLEDVPAILIGMDLLGSVERSFAQVAATLAGVISYAAQMVFFLGGSFLPVLVLVARRVVDELGEQHGPRGRQWTPRPPQVERARMAVPDRLLASGLSVDRFERQSYLDQLALVHQVPNPPCPRWRANLAGDANAAASVLVDSNSSKSASRSRL
mgnify:CR=1 FL=1